VAASKSSESRPISAAITRRPTTAFHRHLRTASVILFVLKVSGFGAVPLLDREASSATGCSGIIPIGRSNHCDGCGRTRQRDSWMGCGNGRLIRQLFDAGFRQVLGVDPYLANAVAERDGFRILKAPLTAVEGKWDVVMFHHSFEHVPDPYETLQQAADRLAETGTCVVRIPTVSSYAWRHYGTNWYALDAPRHLVLFSRDGLALLAERAGLYIETVVDDSAASQFWCSELCARGIPYPSSRPHSFAPRSAFSAKQIRSFEAQARELNQRGEGDQAVFYLKKRVL